MSERGGAPDAPGGGRPAIIVGGLSTGTDDEFLELYFGRFGSDVKCVTLLEDSLQAYVEFDDPSGKFCVCVCVCVWTTILCKLFFTACRFCACY